MKRLIQYYDEDFNLTYNRYKISWMLNLEIIDEDTKIQRLYQISTKTLQECVIHKGKNVGGNYYKIKKSQNYNIVENAFVNDNKNVGMTVRTDYDLLEIYARDKNGNYEGVNSIYEFNGKKISEKLWYNDELIKSFRKYKNGNLAEQKISDGEIQEITQYYPNGELYVFGKCKKIYDNYHLKYRREGLWKFYILNQGYELRNYKNGKLNGIYEIQDLKGKTIYKKKIKYKLGRYFLKRLDLQGNIYKTRVVNGELNYYNDRRNDLIDFDDYWY